MDLSDRLQRLVVARPGRGQDLSSRITLRHLLSHRSGLPDYFQGKRRDGSRFAGSLLAGRDVSYGLPELLSGARSEMKPTSRPGRVGGRCMRIPTSTCWER